jgi:hypothetical protein
LSINVTLLLQSNSEEIERISFVQQYSLLPLFLDTVFPKVEALVGVGGRYAGYVPIIQGDNAGPHQEGDFDASCKAYCHTRG